MRTLALAIVLVVAAGCASAPPGNEFTGSGNVQSAQAFECVSERAGGLGYASINRTNAEVRMERQNDEPFWLNMIGINDSVDVLIANQMGNRLRVSAYSVILRGEERDAAAPSEDARREASEIADACGG